ncbi:multidrug ABC transporter [Spirochaetia bacterium]|nr:multidrug ABC transporter [Spirochaetia bacterium]
MYDKKDWLKRPVTSLCILLGGAVLSVFILRSSADMLQSDKGDISYTVTIRHHGIDLREMERTVAIPLEDALSAIGGVKNILSSSEYGRTRAFVRFNGSGKGRYEAVSAAAQAVYETLPSSAQRPEIVSSNNSRIPLWTAAVFPRPSELSGKNVPSLGTPSLETPSLGTLLEKIVKPALEGLEGAGEVEISGAGLPEIIVILKPEEAAARSLKSSRIAETLAANDLALPGGIIEEGERDILITVDGRYSDAAALSKLLIPLDNGTVIPLEDAAEIREQTREPDTFSRLDGKKIALISVMGSSRADPGRLSRQLAAELKNFSDLPLEFRILSDRGSEETAAYRSVFAAALQSALAVALMILLLGKGKNILICALMVPLSGLAAAALLTVFGILPDRSLLTGLSVGIGAAVDAVILSADRLGKAASLQDGRSALNKLRSPLISGSLTTIAALLPLGIMKSSAAGINTTAAGINTIAWAVAAVTLVSLLAALFILPPIFLSERKNSAGQKIIGNKFRYRLDFFKNIISRLIHPLQRIVFRLLALFSGLAAKQTGAVLVTALLLSLAGIFAVVMAGADVGNEASEDSVYAQIEFEGGFRAAMADILLVRWAEELNTKEGIKSVQTSARTSSGSALVSFYPEKISTEKVRELIRLVPLPGGFVYIPETSAGERIWEITVRGDDDLQCRELAEEAGRLCRGSALIKETVLNFKEGSKRIRLIPRHERFLEAGIYFSETAEMIRRGIHGPVAYKRIANSQEIDVRVRGFDIIDPSGSDIKNFPLAGPSGNILRIDTLMDFKEDREPSGIRREDRLRAASISVRTKTMDPRRVKKEIMAQLKMMELPPGYSLEFDREAIEAAENLSGTTFYFLLALIFCYMIIAAANESFGIPLAILSAVPPSLAVPALFLVLRGVPFNAAAACAFVAVSGMAVNAAVLTADEFRHDPGAEIKTGAFDLYRVLRRRIPALLATGGTTIAGAVPFLFLRENSNQVVRTLALVTALGVTASCICSLIVVPAMAKKYLKFFETYKAFSMPEP